MGKKKEKKRKETSAFSRPDFLCPPQHCLMVCDADSGAMIIRYNEFQLNVNVINTGEGTAHFTSSAEERQRHHALISCYRLAFAGSLKQSIRLLQ